MVEVMCGYREMLAEDADNTRRLVQRAIDLNERSDFAHTILGTFNLYGERDLGSAIREAKRSLELNATYILAMDLLGEDICSCSPRPPGTRASWMLRGGKRTDCWRVFPSSGFVT